MSTSLEFGCIHCGPKLDLTPPDLSHTYPYRSFRFLIDWIDFQFMNAVCKNVKR